MGGGRGDTHALEPRRELRGDDTNLQHQPNGSVAEDGVGHDCGHGHHQAHTRRGERLLNVGRQLSRLGHALGRGDGLECFDHAEHGAQQAKHGRDRADQGQVANALVHTDRLLFAYIPHDIHHAVVPGSDLRQSGCDNTGEYGLVLLAEGHGLLDLLLLEHLIQLHLHLLRAHRATTQEEDLFQNEANAKERYQHNDVAQGAGVFKVLEEGLRLYRCGGLFGVLRVTGLLLCCRGRALAVLSRGTVAIRHSDQQQTANCQRHTKSQLEHANLLCGLEGIEVEGPIGLPHSGELSG